MFTRILVADQTPTPTRFIRNCEEVGLFQDLQNVNPFEETFRRAVEARNTGTLTVSGEVKEIDVVSEIFQKKKKDAMALIFRWEVRTTRCILLTYFRI